MNLLPREIKVDVANTLNAIGVQTPIAQQQIAHKALRNDLSAPKRKHVRKIIVDSWNYGQIDLFKQLEKEPLTKLGNVCFKAFTVIHKVLQEGAPRFLKRSHSAMGFIRHLQNHWESVSNTDIHYGKINALYGYFLRGKITFHYKHPLVLGTLSLDDYQKKIKNQPEVALFIRQQMICHLLDLQDMVLDLEEAILSFHGRDLHETKKAGLVPLVVEADALLRITVHHLTALCDRTNDIKVAKDYINRFNKHYPRLRLFFDNASRIPYVTDLVSVPVLPADPPQFLATGKLAHLVPLPDQTTNVTPLMLGEDDKRGNRSASAYAEQLARERQQQEQANQAQSQANFPSVPVGGIDQNRGSVNFPSVPLGGQGGQQGGQGGVPAANAPTGWVSFGGAAAAPKPVSTSATPVPANWVAFGAGGQPGAGQPGAGQVGAGGQQVGQHPGGAAGQPGASGLNAGFPSVPSGQPQFATPGQQGTSWVGFGNAGQAQQASVAGVAGVPGSPQQGTLSAQAGVATNTASALLSTEAENKYLDLIRQKDEEIAHWKGQYQNAMLLVEELQATVNEHSQRADDLEQHLQDIMQQIQQEKEARLLRKLENAVKNVQNTLGVLTNLELPSNLSSTPEQILSAYHQLLQHLDDVENAAMNRDHESLLNATKGVVVASNQQAEHCKGVAHLTDNKELSNELSNAATRATHGIQKLLETIRDNPYDADPIVADVKQVRELANLLEKATTNIIKEERVEQNPDDNLVDQATAELMRAAKIIEDAAAQLLAAKKQAEEKAKNKENKQQMEVAGTIVGGAMAITDATSLLVKYATILQKENVEAGRARGSSTLYKKDVAWSEGLISAAKSVAASVQELTVRANGCVTQETDPESLVVASKQVAAATAQLLIASRVRSDPNSTAQKNLEMASRAVTQATRTLVLAAQAEVAAEVVEEDTRESLNGLSVTEVKIREMEQQAAILRLEKQLETERIKLASMRKAQYKN